MIYEIITLDMLKSLPPDAAAAQLLIRQDLLAENGESGDEIAYLDSLLGEWLELDPSNGDAWARAAATWLKYGKGISRADLASLHDDRGSRSNRTSWWRPLAASVAIVSAGGGAFVAWQAGLRPDKHIEIAAIRPDPAPVGALYTTSDQVETIVLADASSMTLDHGSAARVSISQGERRVELLAGAGFFSVSHDRAHPFVVAVGDHIVTALGTRFEVRRSGGGSSVELLEGSVSVAAPAGESVILAVGQRLDVGPDGSSRVSAADPADVIDGRSSIIRFTNTPLSVAAAEFSRQSKEVLIVNDPEVGALRISGSFRTADAGRFARTIALIHRVRVIVRGKGRYELVAAPPVKGKERR